jgi:hypothetical protein
MNLFARIVAVIALSAFGGSSVLRANDPVPPPPDGVVVTEDAFLDSLGVNVHVNYNDGAYANLAKMAQDLRYIGLRHVRTHAGGGVVPLESYVRLGRDDGVRFNLIARSDKHPDVSVTFAEQLMKQAPGSVVSIEGFNEVNHAPITFQGARGESAARAAQAALYAKAKSTAELSRLPILYFTGGTAVSDLSGMADAATIHAYNNNASQPGSWFTRAMRQYSGSAAQLPRMNTEFGNFTLPVGWPEGKAYWAGHTDLGVDETTQAKVVLNGFFESVAQGFGRSYVYELLDQKPDPQMKEPQFHFGLFNNAHQPKASAKALHNLTSFLSQTASAGSSGTVTGKIEEASDKIGWIGIRRRDGSLILAVWNRSALWRWDQNLSRPVASAMMPAVVRASSNSATLQASVLDPLTGTHSPLTPAADGSFAISVPNHPLLVWVRL